MIKLCFNVKKLKNISLKVHIIVIENTFKKYSEAATAVVL